MTIVKPVNMSLKTRGNWLVDVAVFLGGVLAALSGLYFLYVPSGGYQGGRNPMYGVTVLFGREAWDNLHAWSGVAMIAAAVVHLAIHWQWIRMMARRMANALRSKGNRLSKGAKINVGIDVLVAVSFVMCALSGVYFLFAPAGGYQGGRNADWDPMFLFSRTVWDLIHTWSGVVLIAAAAVHLSIHWRWVTKVTARFFLSLLPKQERGGVPVTEKVMP
jgi:hypothetical protein